MAVKYRLFVFKDFNLFIEEAEWMQWKFKDVLLFTESCSLIMQSDQLLTFTK